MLEQRTDEVLIQPDGQDALQFLLGLVGSDSPFLRLRNVRKLTVRIRSTPENEGKVTFLAQMVGLTLRKPDYSGVPESLAKPMLETLRERGLDTIEESDIVDDRTGRTY